MKEYIKDRPGISLIPSAGAFVIRSVIIFPCCAESDFLRPNGFSEGKGWTTK